MLSRIWRGWTTFENSAAYEALLKNEVFPSIQNRQLAGYLGIYLLRRNLEMEAEFMTIMWFDSREAIRAFAGEDEEAAVVPPAAQTLLARFEERARHYEVKGEMKALAAQHYSEFSHLNPGG